mmetsp:Transcript_30275/g.63226  ORF Transcript_30275/g.63226 Transcript_30275/m.63226 type:complete len:268 (-) Transcript_30275:2-805(-)
MSTQAETHLHMATQTCYLNLLISIPHFFAFSSALVSSFPVGALPPLSFLCCFKASATVKPGAPDLIISSSSSSSSSSSPRMGPVDNGSCCLTARFAGFFLFPPVPETVEEGAFDDESESCLNLVISNKLSRCGGDGGGGGLVGGAVEGPPSLFFLRHRQGRQRQIRHGWRRRRRRRRPRHRRRRYARRRPSRRRQWRIEGFQRHLVQFAQAFDFLVFPPLLLNERRGGDVLVGGFRDGAGDPRRGLQFDVADSFAVPKLLGCLFVLF